MVRRTIGPPLPVGYIKTIAAHRLDGRRLHRFLLGHWRQDAGQTLREHGLAGTGRANHQQAVTSGGGNFQRTPGVTLAFDVEQIRMRGFAGKIVRHRTREYRPSGQMRTNLTQ